MVGFETASYKNNTKHYNENQPWNTFGCTMPVIFDEVPEERWEAISQQGWNKRGSWGIHLQVSHRRGCLKKRSIFYPSIWGMRLWKSYEDSEKVKNMGPKLY